MDGSQRFLRWIAGVFAMTATAVLAGIGGSEVSAGHRGIGWFIAAGWVFGGAVFVVLMVEVIWPAFPRLSRLRDRVRAWAATPYVAPGGENFGGIDPAVNVPKHLVIDYGTNTGIRETRTYLEGSEVDIP